MSNVAREVIWPKTDNVLVRVAFLYVGQGESTLVLVKDGSTYKTLVLDINRDEQNGGIDVPRLMADVLEEEDGKLGVFVNTHPHNDHLRDVVELSDAVDIHEVWHSGHKPGKKHDYAYKDLQKVIKKVKNKHGNDAETELASSRSATTIGDAEYYVFAPAEYVKDDIDDESDEDRYRRIHEQCAVLKFGKDSTWVMLTGDADRDAWEKRITNYHKKRLPSNVLAAAHHGSRTFFRYDRKDDPYKEALDTIDPGYVILSAPTSKESPHDHPHDDAVELYEEKVGADNVLHTGKNRECFICDIYTDGDYDLRTDTRLVDEYGLDGDDGDDDNDSNSKASKGLTQAVVTGTQVDNRPMGRTS